MNDSIIKSRLPLITAFVIFCFTALYYFFNNYLWLGFLNLFSAGINFFALKFSLKHFELSTVFLSIFNAVIAIITAWLFDAVDNIYIQFAWIAFAVGYLFIAYLFLNKAQKKYFS